MPQLTGEQIRERRWTHVRRLAERHDRLSCRFPRFASVFNALVRSGLESYAHLELPRAVGLLEAGIASFPAAWKREGIGGCRGLWHGYRLRFELADYYQRFACALRRYHEVPLQLLVREAIRPGDTFIDVGANNGLVSLVAAWCVGPSGRVHAFEPNPRVFEHLRWHVHANALAQIRPHELGLSDVCEELDLLVPGVDNFGAGTCAPLPERYGGEIQHRASVRLARADDLPDMDIRGGLMVKLDIEGFELRALRGMTGIIERHAPLVVTEVNTEMLRRAGARPEDIAEFMAKRGYRPFEMGAARALLRMRRLTLRSIDPVSEPLPFDVVWMRSGSFAAARLHPFMCE